MASRKLCVAALLSAYQRLAEPVLIMVHAHTAGAARDRTAVAVQVFIVAGDLSVLTPFSSL